MESFSVFYTALNSELTFTEPKSHVLNLSMDCKNRLNFTVVSIL